jgi:hypothetical protein
MDGLGHLDVNIIAGLASRELVAGPEPILNMAALPGEYMVIFIS